MLVFKRTPSKRPTAEEAHEHRWLLHTEFMIKKRERAVFLGNRLKELKKLADSQRLGKSADDVYRPKVVWFEKTTTAQPSATSSSMATPQLNSSDCVNSLCFFTKAEPRSFIVAECKASWEGKKGEQFHHLILVT
uniref:Uncharacterized protein n=1 Tax=Timema bartmani TaxID=61472 RepID=A0A7R9F199_9NEOP|nr:unnamed protein product [Timema bartmani]